jgi:hypothetical protein
MAKLILQFQGGTPSHTLDIGDDTETLALMREALAGDPVSIPNVELPLDEVPTATNWLTAPDSEVVEAYTLQLFNTGKRLQRRGKRFLDL